MLFYMYKLQGANFTKAYLKNAKFQGADLRGACFAGCNLNTTYFGGADLRQVKDFNWDDAPYIRRAIISQSQFDALPNQIGDANKDTLNFCVAPEEGTLTKLNYLEVRGTVTTDGVQRGAIVYSDPKSGTEIGLLFDGTKVFPVENIDMVKERGTWYRKVEPLPENEQPSPSLPNENRVGGWVGGIYLMSVSTFI